MDKVRAILDRFLPDPTIAAKAGGLFVILMMICGMGWLGGRISSMDPKPKAPHGVAEWVITTTRPDGKTVIGREEVIVYEWGRLTCLQKLRRTTDGRELEPLWSCVKDWW